MDDDPLKALDPEIPIIDPHHHLWHPHADRYFSDAFQKDIQCSGHNVVSTVYVECSVMYRKSGPAYLKPVGEVEFAAGMAAMADSQTFGTARLCERIVGAADLTLGHELEALLDALYIASGQRLIGIRGTANWDPDPGVNSGSRPMAAQGLLLSDAFQAGVSSLKKRGLVYDAWQYHPQTPELCELADKFPDMTMVINHCGGLLGVKKYNTPENFEDWRKMMKLAAQRPNLYMKVGGLSGKRNGFDFEGSSRPGMDELISAWRPYIETCIELFGPDRCMFESNFPVDGVAASYQMLWNVYKSIVKNCSVSEKYALFGGTAGNVYQIAI